MAQVAQGTRMNTKKYDTNAYPSFAKRTWRIPLGVVAHVAGRGSGNPDNDVFYVRIRWSSKLGLQLIRTFETRREARAVCSNIKGATHITRELWEETFFPSTDWESAFIAD